MCCGYLEAPRYRFLRLLALVSLVRLSFRIWIRFLLFVCAIVFVLILGSYDVIMIIMINLLIDFIKTSSKCFKVIKKR